jgi:hypothetical protein
MNSEDINRLTAVISSSFHECAQIEQAASSRNYTAGERQRTEELKTQALMASIALATNLLVNINDLAESMKFVASQHNNSEALFRG